MPKRKDFRKKEKSNVYNTVSIILGIISIASILSYAIYIGIPTGILAIIFSRKEPQSTAGLVLGIMGIIINIWALITLLSIISIMGCF